jgi:hypothetical protein
MINIKNNSLQIDYNQIACLMEESSCFFILVNKGGRIHQEKNPISYIFLGNIGNTVTRLKNKGFSPQFCYRCYQKSRKSPLKTKTHSHRHTNSRLYYRIKMPP